MKKNNKTIIITVITVVLLLVTVSTCVYIIIKNNNSSKETMQIEIEKAWSASISSSAETPKFLTALDNKSNFEVMNVKYDGSKHYTVKVSVTSPDILTEINEYQKSLANGISTKQFDDEITNIINSAELKTTEQTVTVIFVNGEPEVSFSEGFIDAMYGYAYKNTLEQINDLLVIEY